jgi:4,5-dihydroxyphthalate decarboxylase
VNDQILTTVLGNYPHTLPLKTGALRDPRVNFDFVEVEPIHNAFAPMVRRQAYDLSEIAIVTALQAVDFGIPIIILPVILSARFQRSSLIGYRPGGLVKPEALAGRIVGVRAFTQTTGMWVRAALRVDHGVETGAVRWRTREPAHVEQYRDPPFVEHDKSGLSLPDQLRAGHIDAAIMGNDLPKDPDFAPLISNCLEADGAFYARHGFMPVNHVACVSVEAAATKPNAVRGALSLLKRSIDDFQEHPRPLRVGFDELYAPLKMTIEESYHQSLIRRIFSVEEILSPARTFLGKGFD